MTLASCFPRPIRAPGPARGDPYYDGRPAQTCAVQVNQIIGVRATYLLTQMSDRPAGDETVTEG